jgi:hypothetical protein
MNKIVKYISSNDVKNGVITIKVPGPYQISYVRTEKVSSNENLNLKTVINGNEVTIHVPENIKALYVTIYSYIKTGIIYVCVETYKTCYGIRSSDQSDAEQFYLDYLDKNLKKKERSYFLHETIPEGYSLVMEVLPRRSRFHPVSMQEDSSINMDVNEWQAIRTGELALLRDLVEVNRNTPCYDDSFRYWIDAYNLLLELDNYIQDDEK